MAEPFGLEFHLGRRLANDLLISTSLSLDVDSVETRLSFRDLALILSILSQRASLMEQQEQEKKVVLTSSSKTTVDKISLGSQEEKDNAAAKLTHATAYSISLNLGNIKVVIINDFNRQNLPVFRLNLESTFFNADGVLQQMEGIGQVVMGIDYYNPRIFIWEPFIEKWSPDLKFETNSENSALTVSSPLTLQFNVTGIMLDRLLQTYSVLLRAEESMKNVDGKRSEVHDFVIQNLVGEEISIHDVRRDKLLFTIPPVSYTHLTLPTIRLV